MNVKAMGIACRTFRIEIKTHLFTPTLIPQLDTLAPSSHCLVDQLMSHVVTLCGMTFSLRIIAGGFRDTRTLQLDLFHNQGRTKVNKYKWYLYIMFVIVVSHGCG